MSVDTIQHPEREAQTPNDNERFKAPIALETLKKAQYGEGVGIIEGLGIPEETRAAMRAALQGQEAYSSDEKLLVQYGPFEDRAVEDGVVGPVVAKLLELLELDGEYVAANTLYNVYATGAGFARHFDSGAADMPEHPGRPDIEQLSFIYIAEGDRPLWVWPPGVTELENPGQPPFVIQTAADMVIAVRGGAIVHQDQTYPAILHEVPPLEQGTSESVVFELHAASTAGFDE